MKVKCKQCNVLRRISPGQLYIARASSDGKFRRGEVTEIRGENSFLIGFIDYGPSEWKRREELFFVPEMISRHPPAVLQFQLEGRLRASPEEVEQFSLGRKLSLVLRREGAASGSVEEVAHFY